MNHLGSFLGFEVTFGRYRGTTGEIGFDGHWSSPSGFHLVVEVKTTDVYAISTSTLVGYVDQLISGGRIPNWHSALGLYVIGRQDPNTRQFENAIIAEGRGEQLRTISVDSLLSMAEMLTEYDVAHEDILVLVRPSQPSIDPVVELMAAVLAQRVSQAVEVEAASDEEPEAATEPSYWLTPVKADEEQTAEQVIETLVGEASIYAFGERTPGRKHLKPGDWIAFYATGTGVVAHAQVASMPERGHDPRVRDPDRYPWLFRLSNARLYLNDPVVIDSALRSQLDEFRDRDPDRSWAWFVQATRRISGADFESLTAHRAR